MGKKTPTFALLTLLHCNFQKMKRRKTKKITKSQLHAIISSWESKFFFSPGKAKKNAVGVFTLRHDIPR